jgi:hypothetical protein
MGSEIMLVARGGKLVGPISQFDLKKSLESLGGEPEVDFVITEDKGWVPLSTFLEGLRNQIPPIPDSALNPELKLSLRREEVSKLVSGLKWVLVAMICLSVGVMLVWLKTKYL